MMGAMRALWILVMIIAVATPNLAPSLAMAQSVPPPPSDPAARVEWARDEGAKLLAANGKRREVKTLPTGVQYEILRSGPSAGAFPSLFDKVRAHYEGSFIDGTVFDSSYARGQPLTFGLNQVIKGWQEVLPLMRRGDIWRVWVPFDFAYGRAGKGPIGGQETLIFKIELIEVNPKGP